MTCKRDGVQSRNTHAHPRVNVGFSGLKLLSQDIPRKERTAGLDPLPVYREMWYIK